MHEGPGVSISLVGGRNSSIGFIMPSNLSFPMALCRDAKKMCYKRIAETSDGQLAKALVPIAFRDLTPKYAPDQNLVCAIPQPHATAKMAVF